MKEKYAKHLLNKNKEDYDKIAQDFDKKRDWIPPDFTILEKYINKGERILDLGCGNGRFSEIVGNKANYCGVDISERLIEIAKEKYPNGKFSVSQPLIFPFENDFFDKVFCLAVLHHIPSKKFRRAFLKEIKRVLKPDGKLILTVWDLNDNPKARRLLFKYTLLKLIGKSSAPCAGKEGCWFGPKFDFRDVFYPWNNSKGKTLIQRYIHIFSEKELARLVQGAGFVIKEKGILQRSKKGRNIFLIAQKSEKSL